MISPRDLMILIFFILFTIILGTIALTDGIKRRDWFNLIGGVFSLLVASYLIWGLFLVTGNL